MATGFQTHRRRDGLPNCIATTGREAGPLESVHITFEHDLLI